jgi:glycosyltransferase involved in cell wall biosynthesis
MRVSVVIPCFNYGRFLEDAVASVAGQTYKDLEIVIVDDGSTDITGEVARRLASSDPRIAYHYKQNGGLSSARNFGIEKSSGELVCFLDADDLFDNRKVEAQVSFLGAHPETDIVFGTARFFKSGEPGKWLRSRGGKDPFPAEAAAGGNAAMISRLVKNNITVVSAPLIRRTVFGKVGLFDPAYKSYEDWHFWFRCALAGCVIRFHDKPEICTYIRFGHESMMTDTLKLTRAGIQLRKFMMSRIPFRLKIYNAYRLGRTYLKLMFAK